MFGWIEKLLLVALALYMMFMFYTVRNDINWLNTQMAENAKVEALWKEAIKRCLAD